MDEELDCLWCGEPIEDGYVSDKGKIMAKHEDGEYRDTWVWGCAKCQASSNLAK